MFDGTGYLRLKEVYDIEIGTWVIDSLIDNHLCEVVGIADDDSGLIKLKSLIKVVNFIPSNTFEQQKLKDKSLKPGQLERKITDLRMIYIQDLFNNYRLDHKQWDKIITQNKLTANECYKYKLIDKKGSTSISSILFDYEKPENDEQEIKLSEKGKEIVNWLTYYDLVQKYDNKVESIAEAKQKYPELWDKKMTRISKWFKQKNN